MVVCMLLDDNGAPYLADGVQSTVDRSITSSLSAIFPRFCYPLVLMPVTELAWRARVASRINPGAGR